MFFQFDEKDDTLFISSEDKAWDCEVSGFDVGPDLWAAGGGDTTDHIIPANVLWPDNSARLPFVCVLKDDKTVSVKKEEVTTSPTKSACGADVSPGKKHGKRVREEWKVSTKAEEKTCSSNTTQPCNSKRSSGNESSSSSSNNSNTSRDTKHSPVKSEDCEVSAVKQEASTPTEDVIASLLRRTGICVREEGVVRARWEEVVREEENYQPDHPSLNLVHEEEDALGKRAVVVSTIFRYSIVPCRVQLFSSKCQQSFGIYRGNNIFFIFYSFRI